MIGQMKFQIGKNGITFGVLESLDKGFKTHKSIRISLLKSSGRDREKIKKIADELSEKLDGRFRCTIVGFTIIMRRMGSKTARMPKSKA